MMKTSTEANSTRPSPPRRRREQKSQHPPASVRQSSGRRRTYRGQARATRRGTGRSRARAASAACRPETLALSRVERVVEHREDQPAVLVLDGLDLQPHLLALRLVELPVGGDDAIVPVLRVRHALGRGLRLIVGTVAGVEERVRLVDGEVAVLGGEERRVHPRTGVAEVVVGRRVVERRR